MKNLVALLIFCATAFGQEDTPPPPPMPMTPVDPMTQLIHINALGQVVYRTEHLDETNPFRLIAGAQAEPIILIQDVGDTLGVARQLFRSVTLDSADVANLRNAPMEIVPDPENGRYLYVQRLLLEKIGTITRPAAGSGLASLRAMFTDATSGFLGTFSPTWNVSFSGDVILFNDPLAEVGTVATAYSLVLPSAFGGTPLTPDIAFKIGGAVTPPEGETAENAWVNIWSGMAADARLKITVWYSIYDPR